MQKANDYTRAGHWFTLAATTAALSAVLSQKLTPLLIAAAAGYLAHRYYNLGKKDS